MEQRSVGWKEMMKTVYDEEDTRHLDYRKRTQFTVSEQEVTESQTGAETVLCDCDGTFMTVEGAVRSSINLTDVEEWKFTSSLKE